MPDHHSIRPGEPTAADAAAFASLADMATDGLLAALFGPGWERAVGRIHRRRRNDLGFEHTRFVIVDGAIAGMTSSYGGRQHHSDRRRTALLLARHAGWRLPRVAFVALAYRRVLSFMDRVDPDDHYLQMLAVAPRHRGRGLGTALLTDAEAIARRRGAASLILDVAVENHGAIALYRRYGFGTVMTSPTDAPFGDSVTVQRMVKPLPRR